MELRPLGRTGLRLSAVALGTAQLRLVPEAQALATLRRAFELGVNCVHTAPDYEGADALVARAVREWGREVVVLSQGYGDPAHFAFLFEQTCRLLGRERLELFGIACVEDRVQLGENVWGRGGLVELLLGWKRQGRLGGLFCTTHGGPELVARLIGSGVFDAVMLPFNPLGFHLLSCRPDPLRTAEDMARVRDEILPMAERLGVGILAMKPLAGGLLARGRAFPARAEPAPGPRPAAGDVLRAVLQHPQVTCVVPGAASPEEAEENARAGHPGPAAGPAGLEPWLAELRTSLCSRCGVCDSLCSRHLPVSWLLRDAYLQSYPSETFEAVEELSYFHLHPGARPTCAACDDVTCRCPAGIDVPRALLRAHAGLHALRERGLLPATPGEWAGATVEGRWPATVISRDLPALLAPGGLGFCRLYVQNAGGATWWRPGAREGQAGVRLGVWLDGGLRQWVPLRHDVEPGARAHFVFVLTAPPEPGRRAVELALAAGDSTDEAGAQRTVLARWPLDVRPEPAAP